MARIIMGALVGGITGSIGGISLAPGRTGAIARTKPHPPNTLTARRAAARNAMAYLSPLWRGLTPAQRSAWQTYGLTLTRTSALGDSYTLDGLAAFLLVNAAALDVVADYHATAPTSPGGPSTPMLDLDFNAGSLRVASIAPSLAAGETIYLRVDCPAPDSRPSASRITTATAKITSATSLPFIVQTGYATNFAAGSNLIARARYRFRDAAFRTSEELTTSLPFVP